VAAAVTARVKVGIAVATLLAAVLRFWGLSYALPHPLGRPDEEIVVGHALELSLGPAVDRDAMPYPELLYIRDPVRGRAIAPRLGLAFPYPDLVYDIDAGALAAWRLVEHWRGRVASPAEFVAWIGRDHPAAPFLVARSVSAIAGTATVVAAALAAWWAYRRRSVAALAALLVAVNFLHARDSHYATVDATLTLMVTLAMAFAARTAASGRRRDAVWSGVFVGLAASAKFNGAAVALSTAAGAAHRMFVRTSPAARRRLFWTLVFSGVAAIGVFALTSPWCVQFYKTVDLGLRIQRRVLFGTPGPPAGLAFLTHTLPGAFGWPAFGLAVAGVGRALWKRRGADIVFLAFLVPAFLSMAAITWVLPRYPVPLVPVLAIFAAEAAAALVFTRVPGWAAALLVVAMVAPPLSRIVQYDRLAARPDTRLLAASWIADRLPAGSRVAVCRGYGAPRLNTDASRGPALDEVLVLPCNAERLQAAGAGFVITHQHPAIDFFAPADDAQAWLEANGQRVATFSPFVRADAGRSDVSGPIRQCFYRGDAFYLPYCDFGAVDRGGPVISVWALARQPVP
jgi:hypothetical protein